MTILNVFKRIEEQKMLSVLFYKFKFFWIQSRFQKYAEELSANLCDPGVSAVNRVSVRKSHPHTRLFRHFNH
jgi:hypothetical protein